MKYSNPSRYHSSHINFSSLLYTFFSKFLFPSLFLLWLWSVSLTAPTANAKNETPRLRGISDIQSISDISLDLNSKIDHLIIVAGHAVIRLNQLANARTTDQAWYLLPYQLNQGFPDIISSHIMKGINLIKEDRNALLLFSGGQTRQDVGPLSEAASYYYVAKELNWLTNLEKRVYLEEFARDSFENLLFSICRFREIQGYYPSKVSVVGFDFKSDRFVNLHREAIRFPLNSFTYYGLKPDTSLFDHKKASNGEKDALKAFENDMYGCIDTSLSSKRDIRNPFRRTNPYELACPEIKELLKYCGNNIFNGLLPWDSNSKADLRTNDNSIAALAPLALSPTI